MPKGNSGIKRDGGKTRSAHILNNNWMRGKDVTKYDRYAVWYEQDRYKGAPIPDYISEDMTDKEIHDSIISHATPANKHLNHMSGDGISVIAIDGRYSAPKDKRFAELVRGMNATKMEGGVGNSFDNEFLISRIEKLTSGYSTKELRQFVTQELGLTPYRGGRPGYLDAIWGDMYGRFTDHLGTLQRQTLGQESHRVERLVNEIKSRITQREIATERINAIKKKYQDKR